jgi:phosphatidylserine/phosphatidylglycerophosphate/cardiolipin synthase-like enzyme
MFYFREVRGGRFASFFLIYLIVILLFLTLECHADNPPDPFTINISYYPKYIGKIPSSHKYGFPFSIKVDIKNATPYENISIKAYIVGNFSHRYPATQIWNPYAKKWSYSYYYLKISANNNGYWSEWLHIRFKKDYKEYRGNIWNASTAWLKVKCKRENGEIEELTKQIFLLDMDNSTSNGFSKGGFVSGIAGEGNTVFQNKVVLIQDKNHTIIGSYVTENNCIDENYPSVPGYYKLTAPVGEGYQLVIREKENMLYSIENITVQQGFYNFKMESNLSEFFIRPNEDIYFSILLENTGTLSELINLEVKDLPVDWSYAIEYNKIFLKPKERFEIKIEIYTTFQNISSYSLYFNISAVCQNDISVFHILKIAINFRVPDLIVADLSAFRDRTSATSFGEGEIILLKTKIKNIGSENATDFNVTFYYDSINDSKIIGVKHYDNITKYPKYPSIKWDTKGLSEGLHSIFVVVDGENTVFEFDEGNNVVECIILIENTTPSENERKLLITHVYPYAHPNMENEFVTIYNPTTCEIDISGWYLTDDPFERVDKQSGVFFPDNSIMKPFSYLCITQNATAYYMETGKKPSFEYKRDSREDIPQMLSKGTFALNNKGDIVVLKDRYNHTIDVVQYGNISKNYDIGWDGKPIDNPEIGIVLRRSFKDGAPLDTNTSHDWQTWRKYRIGQSDFEPKNFSILGEVKAFVSPDCSFDVITDELRSAKKSIYINMYEFTNPFLMDEIIAALNRNISVTILLERSPAGGIDRREMFILQEISNHGGKIRFIGKSENIYSRYNFNHAKYVIIDNETSIIESANWGKTGVPINNTFGNREWGVIIKNKTLASYLLGVFLDDCNISRIDVSSLYDISISTEKYLFLDYFIPNGFYNPKFEPISINGSLNVTLILSPDNSLPAILKMIKSANSSIYVEQLYIYKHWSNNKLNPLLEELINRSKSGVDVRVVLNYNTNYEYTNEINNETYSYLINHSVNVKFVYTNWSYFTNIHNKGIIVDNQTVLISSINWNEKSFLNNRELGIIIENSSIAKYFANIFIYDWSLKPLFCNKSFNNAKIFISFKKDAKEYKNQICIVIIFVITAIVIAFDWRRREW